ncbi:MAG: ChbG/HpnK family deacetylase [Clostridia bacterium]
MKLIINADDFGLSEGVTYGIYDAIKNGVVSSTTMMASGRASQLAGLLTKTDNTLAVGLHLNISLGKPLTNCASLLQDGIFVKPKQQDYHLKYTVEDLDMEFEAQYERFCELCQKEPTHIDSHLYTHQIYENVKEASIRLGNKHKIPIRDCSTDYFNRIEYDGRFKLKPGESESDLTKRFFEIIDDHKSKCDELEILAHPAFMDDYMIKSSTYNIQRTLEYNVLKSEEVKEYLLKNSIELTNYKFMKRK